jgi:hypothetical protein
MEYQSDRYRIEGVKLDLNIESFASPHSLHTERKNMLHPFLVTF